MISYPTFLIIIHWGGESWVLHADRQFIQDVAKKYSIKVILNFPGMAIKIQCFACWYHFNKQIALI